MHTPPLSPRRRCRRRRCRRRRVATAVVAAAVVATAVIKPPPLSPPPFSPCGHAIRVVPLSPDRSGRSGVGASRPVAPTQRPCTCRWHPLQRQPRRCRMTTIALDWLRVGADEPRRGRLRAAFAGGGAPEWQAELLYGAWVLVMTARAVWAPRSYQTLHRGVQLLVPYTVPHQVRGAATCGSLLRSADRPRRPRGAAASPATRMAWAPTGSSTGTRLSGGDALAWQETRRKAPLEWLTRSKTWGVSAGYKEPFPLGIHLKVGRGRTMAALPWEQPCGLPRNSPAGSGQVSGTQPEPERARCPGTSRSPSGRGAAAPGIHGRNSPMLFDARQQRPDRSD